MLMEGGVKLCRIQLGGDIPHRIWSGTTSLGEQLLKCWRLGKPTVTEATGKQEVTFQNHHGSHAKRGPSVTAASSSSPHQTRHTGAHRGLPARSPGLNLMMSVQKCQLWSRYGIPEGHCSARCIPWTHCSGPAQPSVLTAGGPGSKARLPHCPHWPSPTGQACTPRRGRSFLSAGLSALSCKRPILWQ